MNLSVKIPEQNVRELAERFLRLDYQSIIAAADYVNFMYALDDNHQLVISVFNEEGRADLTEEACVIMLFEDMNELELSIQTIDTLSKSSYPADVLGSPSYDYLLVKDTISSNGYFFTLDSIQYVLDYLCLLYHHDNKLIWVPAQ